MYKLEKEHGVAQGRLRLSRYRWPSWERKGPTAEHRFADRSRLLDLRLLFRHDFMLSLEPIFIGVPIYATALEVQLVGAQGDTFLNRQDVVSWCRSVHLLFLFVPVLLLHGSFLSLARKSPAISGIPEEKPGAALSDSMTYQRFIGSMYGCTYSTMIFPSAATTGLFPAVVLSGMRR